MGLLDEMMKEAARKKQLEQDIAQIALLVLFSAVASHGLSGNPKLTSEEVADKSVDTAICILKRIKGVKPDEL